MGGECDVGGGYVGGSAPVPEYMGDILCGAWALLHWNQILVGRMVTWFVLEYGLVVLLVILRFFLRWAACEMDI